jgi:hypothetical protein
MVKDRREDSAEWRAKDWQAHFSGKLWPMVIKDIRSSGSGSQIITMMQAAKSRHRYDRAI